MNLKSNEWFEEGVKKAFPQGVEAINECLKGIFLEHKEFLCFEGSDAVYSLTNNEKLDGLYILLSGNDNGIPYLVVQHLDNELMGNNELWLDCTLDNLGENFMKAYQYIHKPKEEN